MDGVLNPYVSNGQAKALGLTRRRAWGEPGDRKMHLDPALVQPVRSASAMFRLAWASWRDLPGMTLNPWFGLQVPEVHFDYQADSGSKVPGILRFVGDDPFVWVDDDVTEHERKSLAQSHSRHLILTPEPSQGMGEDHLREALDWAGGL